MEVEYLTVTLDPKKDSELIEKLKPMVYELKYFQIVKEELYRGTQKLKEDKTVPPDNGIELEITVK